MNYFNLLFFFISWSTLAQLPETDIWLFKIEKKNEILTLTKPTNVTNREGYDNQPCFSTDGKKLFYVQVDSSLQADVYQYAIEKRTRTNLTKSEVSEYSPTVMPGCNGFSAVVVEKDSTQRIWQFNLDGTFHQIIAEYIDSVGYHGWVNTDTILYYKLSEPHSLRVLDTKRQLDVWICDNPARSFKNIYRGSQFMYAIKDSTNMEFRIYDPTLKESRRYALLNSIQEDFLWHPHLGLIVSKNSTLLRYNEKKVGWETLFDFSSFGIKMITRFVFDRRTGQLAIVSNL